MNAEVSLELLLRLAVLFNAAVLLLALLRPLLMRTLGAQATYLSWLLVPTLMASPWLPLPASAGNAPPLPAVVAMAAQVATATQALPLAGGPATAAQGASSWLIAWLAGTALLAAGQVALQRRYTAVMRRDADGRWVSPAGTSPAVVGLWPQRLVLPQDFTQRFDVTAQRLVLAHEAVHARRHDNAWNLLAAALLCLQWFNPLAWWAWGRLRHDQELACDAAVLTAEASPVPLAAYANAMLAAHRAPWQPALASGWATRHPLVERVRMLSRHRGAPKWRHAGAAALVVGLGSGAALMAQAAQSPAAHAMPVPGGRGLMFDVSSQVGSQPWVHRQVVLPQAGTVVGGPAAVMMSVMQPGWCLALTIHGFADGSIRPTAQAFDETCQSPVSDDQELRVDGRPAHFVAKTAGGTLQAQLATRFVDPASPQAQALMKAQREESGPLSAAQQAQMARHHAQIEKVHRDIAAQDRAWRDARDAAAH